MSRQRHSRSARGGSTKNPTKRLFIFGAGATCGTLKRPGVKGFGEALAREVPGWRDDRHYSALARFVDRDVLPGEPVTNAWALDAVWTRIDYQAKLWRGLASLGVGRDDTPIGSPIHRALAAVYGTLDLDYLGRAWRSERPFTLRDVLRIVGPNDVVVSFNWDVLVELLLVRFSGVGALVVQAPHKAKDVVTLAKPHGSLSWRREFPPHGDAPDFLGVGLAPLLTVMRPEDIDDRHQPLLLGALPMKSELLAEVQVKHPWVHLRVMEQWSALCGGLRDAEEVYVVGYSFPDEDGYGRFLLGEAMRRRLRPCRIVLYELREKRKGVEKRMSAALGTGLDIDWRGSVVAPKNARGPAEPA